MIKTWKVVLVVIVVGGAAFFAGPMLWPMTHDAPQPPATLLPLYIAMSAIEALAFGFAVAFAAFGWPVIRNLQLGAPWLNKLLFVTLLWFIGNWWIHDNLHMHVGLDMDRLIYIEYGFHATMLVCAITFVIALMRLQPRGETGKPA